MRPILIASDYSDAARNAGDYAAQLAKAFNTSLYVLHTWTIPVASAEAVAVPLPLEEFTASETAAVESEASRLSKKWQVPVSGIQRIDFTPEGIEAEVKANNIGLVVMGMHKHNAIGRFFGSTVTAQLHKADYPILVIPEGVQYHHPSAILMATDLSAQLSGKGMATLKTIATQFDAVVHLVHVNEEDEIWNVQESDTSIRLDKRLVKVKHAWHFPKGGKPEQSIIDEAQAEKADWVAVAPHRMPWYEEVFHRSVSRRLSFSSDRPLLILPLNEM